MALRSQGPSIVVAVPLLSVFFAPLVFSSSLPVAVGDMALRGIGMGAQESIGAVVALSVASQLAAVPVLWVVRRQLARSKALTGSTRGG